MVLTVVRSVLPTVGWHSHERSGAVLYMQEAGAIWHGFSRAFIATSVGFLVAIGPAMGQKTADWQVEGVLAALHDRDEAVWIHALDTLGEFELLPAQQQALVSDARYQDIISFLADTQSNPLQAAALKAIAVTGAASEHTTALKIIPLLQDGDREVRQAAVDALSHLRAHSHLNQILPRLHDREPAVQQAAIQAVGHLGGPQHAYLLRPFLLIPPTSAATPQSPLSPVNTAPLDLRLATIQALAELGASNYSAELVPFLLNSNPQLRQAASQALGQLNARDRIPDLVRLLEDPRWQARDAASQALGFLEATSTIPHATTLLGHPSWPVRQVAIHTLVRLGTREAIPSIAHLLTDPEAKVRAAAAEALGQLGDSTNGERLLLLLQDEAVVVRQAAIAAIGQLGNSQPDNTQLDSPQQHNNFANIRAVTSLLDDRDSSVRQAALRTLAQLNARATQPQIVALLRDRDAGVRQAAVLALGQLEAHNALPFLLPLLVDDSAKVQQATGEAVSQLLWRETALGINSPATLQEGQNVSEEHEIEAISASLNLLHNRQWSARQVGVQLLSHLEVPDPLPHITARLSDRHPDVRQTAYVTWVQLGPHNVPNIYQLLESTYGSSLTDRAHLRFLAYYSSGGHPDAITTLQWLGKPLERPSLENTRQRVQLLEQLYLHWPSTEGAPKLRSDMAQLMAQLVSNGNWTSGGIQRQEQQSLLTELETSLRQDGFTTRADTIRSARSGLSHQRQLRLLRRYLTGHAITWLMLWLLYPICVPIQILVWHPWLRRILGHGYIGWLLLRVPVLRARLLAPWQAALSGNSFAGSPLSGDSFDRHRLAPNSPLCSTEAIEHLDLYNYRYLGASSTFLTCDWPQRDHRSTPSIRNQIAHFSVSGPAYVRKAVLVTVDAEACERGVETAVRGVVARTV
ncbi:MAG: HEAT repeat domain-containing protein, partial [Cyanobacteria bacterium P01_E01_bin.34]